MKAKPYEQFWNPMIPRYLVYPEVPLFRTLEVAAEFYPDKTAIIYYGREISYRELVNSVHSLAGALHKRGVGKGDRVAIYMQNTPHFVVSLYAAMRANAVAVPVNPMWQKNELEFLLQDCGATALILTSELAGNVRDLEGVHLKTVVMGSFADYLPPEPSLPVPDFMAAQEGAPVPPGFESWNGVLAEQADPPPVEIRPGDLSLLPYTSGSTGVPKGCMHTHKTVIAPLLGAYFVNNMVSSSVNLVVLPLFHVTGLVHSLMAPLYTGATLVMLTRWDRDAALAAIEKYRCTHFTNISTMVVDLLSAPDLDQRDISSLRSIGGGGAPLPEAVGEKLREKTGLTYMEGYGLTETISTTHSNPRHRPKFQCLGIPFFGIDARIIDQESLEELEDPNRQGELVINGPNVFLGYWNRPEDTAEAFLEIEGKQFFRTGDICYMDEEGYFFLVDRTKRMINAAGFKVWPAEVENYLYKNEHVQEACVEGVPDPRRGEQVRAYVVLKPGSEGAVEPGDIIAWARGEMAAYKYPRQVIFVGSLPKSGSGKILWKEMQEQARKEANA